MDNKQTPDTSFLWKYRDDLNSIFETYTNRIYPFIVLFEIDKNEFPIELQNEIRAMYTHLARASLATNEDEVISNIKKIESHTKRAMLDCYKYCSVNFKEEYDDFFSKFHGIDFSILDNGKFMPMSNKLYQKGKQKLKDAKIAEATNLTQEELFSKYEEAFLIFAKLKRLTDNSLEQALLLKRKADENARLAEKYRKRSELLTWVGIIISILTFLLGKFL